MNNLNYITFEVFTAVTMKNAVFWYLAPFWHSVNRRFWGTYLLRFQGRKIRERGTSVSMWLQTASTPMWSTLPPSLLFLIKLCVFNSWLRLLTLVLRSWIFLHWRWRRYVPPKRRFTQNQHCATSQEIAFFDLNYISESNCQCLERVRSHDSDILQIVVGDKPIF
jgi:hypothetical protein